LRPASGVCGLVDEEEQGEADGRGLRMMLGLGGVGVMWQRSAAVQHTMRRITEGIQAGLVAVLYLAHDWWWATALLLIMAATLVAEVRNLRRGSE
jgi:hypothetical protein